MPTDHNAMYRENLRKKLGLGEKKIAEESPVEAEAEVKSATLGGVEGPGHEAAEGEVEGQEEQVSPEADALLTEILQFIDEKEKEAGDVATKLMLKSLYLHLSKNKSKILQKMADDSQ
jgi:hypothetical protein